MDQNNSTLIEDVKEFVKDTLDSFTEVQSLMSNWTNESSSSDSVDAVFRFFHGVKGASGLFNLHVVGEVFHIAESLLDILRTNRKKPLDEDVELLFSVVDQFIKITDHFTSTGEEPADKPYELLAKLAAAKDHYLSKDSDEVRTEANENEIGEMVQRSDDDIRINSHQAQELVEIVSDYIHLENALGEKLGSDTESGALKNEISRYSNRLQSFVLNTRLTPMKPMLTGLQRVTMITARNLGKKVNVKIHGAENQLDRRLIEFLREPLIHIIRNALDHGIELPNEREAAGKTPVGQMVFEATHVAGNVVLTISDDGKGMDPLKIREVAISKNIISREEAKQLSDRDSIQLIFKPGFSTASVVTNISGRGVGMDAVLTSIKSFGGTVDVQSTVGQGSKIVLTLPLSLAIVKSLTFFVGGQIYAVPQANVIEVIAHTLADNGGKIASLDGGGRVLHRRHRTIPVVSLAELMGFNETSLDGGVYIIVRDRGIEFAMHVETIMGPWDFVAQPAPSNCNSCKLINGVHQINNGMYISLLNLASITNEIEKPFAGECKISKYGELTSSEVFRVQQRLIFFKSGRPLALPAQTIKKVTYVSASDIGRIGESAYLTYQGNTYPVLQVSKYFTSKDIEAKAEYHAIFVERERTLAVILCEEFYGIRRLPSKFEPMIRAKGVQGAVNSEGVSYFVLNVPALFEMEFPGNFSEKKIQKQSYKILIAEDDPFFASTLKELFSSEGFDVHQVYDGFDAKQIIENSNPGDWNLILTDYEMPKTNGLELLSFVRSHNQWSEIPVILFSAMSQAIALDAKKMGATACIEKIKMDSLVPIVQQIRNGSYSETNEKINENKKTDRILSFEVCGHHYAIEIDYLKEVAKASVATRVPNASESVDKMIGFRGHPIPVLDLRSLTTVGKSTEDKEPQQIVLKSGDFTCALWVDKIGSIYLLESTDRVTGLVKQIAESEKISGLVSDVLWQSNRAHGLIDLNKVRLFFEQAESLNENKENTQKYFNVRAN